MERDETLPMFASNRPDKDETVASALNKLFGVMRGKLRETPNIAIATAFLNPAGFHLIADELEKAPQVRLLLGAEPEQEVIRAISDSDADRSTRLADALKRHSDWMIAERDAPSCWRTRRVATIKIQMSETGIKTFQPNFINWS